MAKNKLFVKHF